MSPAHVAFADELRAKIDSSLSISRVAKLTKTSPQTVGRWIDRGAVGRDGERRCLDCFRVGQRRLVPREALTMFIVALNLPPK